jgi:hypothetical protein
VAENFYVRERVRLRREDSGEALECAAYFLSPTSQLFRAKVRPAGPRASQPRR